MSIKIKFLALLCAVSVLAGVASARPVRSDIAGVLDGLDGETPSAYFVEYLESSGTQWIDTRVQVKDSISVSTEALVFELGFGMGCCPIGGAKSFNTLGKYIYIAATTTAYGCYNSTERNVGQIVFGQWFSLNIEANVYSIDTTSYTFTKSVFSCPVTFALFARNNATGPNQMGYGCRLRETLIWDGEELVRDFCPIRFRNEFGQWEGAMLDMVSGELFRNQGTGAFSYGQDLEVLNI